MRRVVRRPHPGVALAALLLLAAPAPAADRYVDLVNGDDVAGSSSPPRRALLLP